MNTVNTTTFITDIILNVRNDLAANITDPESSTRPTNQKFVMTSYPQRGVMYPLITVKKMNVKLPYRLGMQSNLHLATVPLEIRVWARNVKEKDNLTQLVINRLRGIQLTVGGSIVSNMLSFEIPNVTDVDEEGEAGIKSSVISTQYKFIVGA